jgi:hypothetical protein
MFIMLLLLLLMMMMMVMTVLSKQWHLYKSKWSFKS